MTHSALRTVASLHIYLILKKIFSRMHCTRPYLKNHFDGEHDGENMVHDVEQLPLHRPRRDVGPLHGERDAVGRYERQDDEVEPVLAGELGAPDPETVVGAEEPEGVIAPLGGEPGPPLPERRQSGHSGGDGHPFFPFPVTAPCNSASGVVQFCKLQTSLTN